MLRAEKRLCFCGFQRMKNDIDDKVYSNPQNGFLSTQGQNRGVPEIGNRAPVLYGLFRRSR